MPDIPAPLMNPSELARYLGVPLQTLYSWRSRGKGPTVVKVGKHLRYRREDVDAWLTRNTNEAAS